MRYSPLFRSTVTRDRTGASAAEGDDTPATLGGSTTTALGPDAEAAGMRSDVITAWRIDGGAEAHGDIAQQAKAKIGPRPRKRNLSIRAFDHRFRGADEHVIVYLPQNLKDPRASRTSCIRLIVTRFASRFLPTMICFRSACRVSPEK